MQQAFEFAKTNILPYWTFIIASLAIGKCGGFAKNQLWTKDRAKDGGIWWWGRATLTLHPPLIGLLAGLSLVFLYGDGAPAGPGVSGAGQVLMYYVGAGALSSLVFAAFKKFAAAKGLKIGEAIDMPELDEE